MNKLAFCILTCTINSLLIVKAFVIPKALHTTRTASGTTHHALNTSLNLSSESLFSEVSSLILNDDAEAIAQANAALGAVRTFFIVVTAILFAGAGLTYFVASVIVPQAAMQLERDTKRLRPGLWEEYEAKLGEGETMERRPDLLQELGNIMQPIIIKDFEDSADAKFSEKERKDESSDTNTKLGNSGQWRDESNLMKSRSERVLIQ
jgi:hypothetical protein